MADGKATAFCHRPFAICQTATPLVNTYEGKLLNGPNDIWVSPTSGRIY